MKMAAHTDVELVAFHQCQFGLKSASGVPQLKPTTLMTNSKAVVKAFEGRLCRGGRVHQEILGQESGSSRACAASVYPMAMRRAIVDALISEIQ